MLNEYFGRNDGYEDDERLKMLYLDKNGETPHDHFNK